MISKHLDMNKLSLLDQGLHRLAARKTLFEKALTALTTFATKPFTTDNRSQVSTLLLDRDPILLTGTAISIHGLRGSLAEEYLIKAYREHMTLIVGRAIELAQRDLESSQIEAILPPKMEPSKEFTEACQNGRVTVREYE